MGSLFHLGRDPSLTNGCSRDGLGRPDKKDRFKGELGTQSRATEAEARRNKDEDQRDVKDAARCRRPASRSSSSSASKEEVGSEAEASSSRGSFFSRRLR